jgi:hypothetical protein
VVDNEVDNVRRQAAATLLEQAAALVRVGSVAEAEALARMASDLLTPPGADVVPLKVRRP